MDGITDSMDMSFSRLRELLIDREAWYAAVTRLSECTELNIHMHVYINLYSHAQWTIV